MSAVKRAWLYLRRKMGRTVILLAVLAVLSVLVLLCISVGNAADTALQNLRKTMGGYFRVSTDYEKGGEQQVDEEMVKKILEVEGIKAWNGLDTTYLLVEDAYLKPGRFTGEGDYRASLARFFSCSDTSLHEYFFPPFLLPGGGAAHHPGGFRESPDLPGAGGFKRPCGGRYLFRRAGSDQRPGGSPRERVRL